MGDVGLAIRETGLISVTDDEFVAACHLTTRSMIDQIFVDDLLAARGVSRGGHANKVRLGAHNGVRAGPVIGGGGVWMPIPPECRIPGVLLPA